MCNLALFGRNSGKRRYLLGHPLAAAVWTHRAALFKVRDVKNLGKFLVAILTEQNVVRHGRFLLDRSSLHIYGSAPGYLWKPRSLYPSREVGRTCTNCGRATVYGMAAIPVSASANY